MAMSEPLAEADHASAGRIAAVLVREGLRARLATRLAYALLPTVRDMSTPPGQED